jgi:hypothetical protein
MPRTRTCVANRHHFAEVPKAEVGQLYSITLGLKLSIGPPLWMY